MGVEGIFAFDFGEFEFLTVQLGDDFGSPMFTEFRELLIYVYFCCHSSLAVFRPLEASRDPLTLDTKLREIPGQAQEHIMALRALKRRNLDLDFHFFVNHAGNHHGCSRQNITEMLFDNR